MLSRFLSPRADLSRGEDPFGSLQREIGRVVEDAFRGSTMLRGLAGGFSPSLDMKETPEGLELTAELPGLEEKDIELSLEGDTLSLSGEKRSEKVSEERGMHLQERSYGRFQRSLRLPFTPESGKVTAQFDKGVLHVMLPRPAQQAAKDNRIPIRAANGAPPNGREAAGTGDASSGPAGENQVTG